MSLYARRDHGFRGVDIVRFEVAMDRQGMIMTTKTTFLMDIKPSDCEAWTKFVNDISQNVPSTYQTDPHIIAYDQKGLVTFALTHDDGTTVVTLKSEACMESFVELTKSLCK